VEVRHAAAAAQVLAQFDRRAVPTEAVNEIGGIENALVFDDRCFNAWKGRLGGTRRPCATGEAWRSLDAAGEGVSGSGNRTSVMIGGSRRRDLLHIGLWKTQIANQHDNLSNPVQGSQRPPMGERVVGNPCHSGVPPSRN
jgi:hypothetical protein